MPISIIPLGAGQDVGRSCILAKVNSKVIMLDCGMHMGYRDERKYPDFTYISASLNPTVINSYVDVVIISHYHLDHCGALPYFTEKIGYSGPIIMTYPTKSVSSVLLADCCKIMEQKFLVQKTTSESTFNLQETTNSTEYGFFTIADVWNCMEKVKTVQLHQTLNISGIKITPYYAGHVLGAAIFHIQIEDETIIYTGDFNMVRDRHLGPAVLPKLSPNLLLSESTYATYIRPSRRSTERNFCEMILSCLKKGGKVLIPVFAIGRAQELCILLEIFWRRMQLRYPIFFGGSMTEKANSYYQLFTNWTNTPLADNIFSFPHVLPYDKTLLTSSGPAVLFATPGMLHTGLSLQAFKIWAPDPNNLVIIPGFCVPGTIGAKIISGCKRVFIDQRDPSTCIEVRCNVKYLSFSSHADSIGIQSLISYLDPKSVAFIHGERQGMLNLASFINSELKIPTFCPHNGSLVTIPTKSKMEYSSHFFVESLSTNPILPQNYSTEECCSQQKRATSIKNMIISDYNQCFEDSNNANNSKIHSYINENSNLRKLSILIFLFKLRDCFRSLVIDRDELSVRIRTKFMVNFQKIFNLKCFPENSNIENLNNIDDHIKGLPIFFGSQDNNFENTLFNLSFSLNIEDLEFSSFLKALNNLRKYIGTGIKSQYNNTEFNNISKKVSDENLYLFDKMNDIMLFSKKENILIKYKSLLIYFKVNIAYLGIIQKILSETNLDKYKNDFKNVKIQKITISWSYIDHKSTEITNFIKSIEIEVNENCE